MYRLKTHDIILAALRKRSMTCEEVAEATGLPLYSVRPRVSELHNHFGEIRQIGESLSLNNSQKRCAIWAAKKDLAK